MKHESKNFFKLILLWINAHLITSAKKKYLKKITDLFMKILPGFIIFSMIEKIIINKKKKLSKKSMLSFL